MGDKGRASRRDDAEGLGSRGGLTAGGRRASDWIATHERPAALSTRGDSWWSASHGLLLLRHVEDAQHHRLVTEASHPAGFRPSRHADDRPDLHASRGARREAPARGAAVPALRLLAAVLATQQGRHHRLRLRRWHVRSAVSEQLSGFQSSPGRPLVEAARGLTRATRSWNSERSTSPDEAVGCRAVFESLGAAQGGRTSKQPIPRPPS
jgi:hypothetical protein